jgi:hypothetical protein
MRSLRLHLVLAQALYFWFGFHTGNDLITNRIVMRIVMQVYCRTGIWVGAAAG